MKKNLLLCFLGLMLSSGFTALQANDDMDSSNDSADFEFVEENPIPDLKELYEQTVSEVYDLLNEGLLNQNSLVLLNSWFYGYGSGLDLKRLLKTENIVHASTLYLIYYNTLLSIYNLVHTLLENYNESIQHSTIQSLIELINENINWIDEQTSINMESSSDEMPTSHEDNLGSSNDETPDVDEEMKDVLYNASTESGDPLVDKVD